MRHARRSGARRKNPMPVDDHGMLPKSPSLHGAQPDPFGVVPKSPSLHGAQPDPFGVVPKSPSLHGAQPDPFGVVHVYAQEQWHDEAFIVGDARALAQLRDAIETALASGRGSALVMAADGEGYRLHVVRHETARMDRMVLPYADSSRILGPEPKGRYPSSLVSHHREGEGEDEILGDDEWFEMQRKFGMEYEK
jgi:hypothetical protein